MADITVTTDTTPRQDADIWLRKALAEAIKKSGKGYKEVAGKLGVSTAMLYNYASCKDEFDEKRKIRFPAFRIRKLCQIVGNDHLQRHVLSARLRKLLKLAEHELVTRRLARELLRKQKRKTNNGSTGKTR